MKDKSKLEIGMTNVAKAYNLSLVIMKNELKRAQSDLSQYEDLLQVKMNELNDYIENNEVEMNESNRDYVLLNNQIKDLSLKVSLSNEIIAEYQAGLIENGEE